MSDEEAPQPLPNPNDPRRTGHRWLDMVVAFSALMISVVSVFVAQQSNQSMERITRASAWPFIQIGSGNASDEGAAELNFNISNVGTGPARVYTYDVQVDGRPLPPGGHLLTRMLQACCNAEFEAAITRAGGEVAAMDSEMSSPVAERFIAPEGDITSLRWPRTEQNRTLWTALDRARQVGRITTTVCYCSVFDECWIARSDSFPPEETNSCTSEALQPEP
jgi:hypothetical protein